MNNGHHVRTRRTLSSVTKSFFGTRSVSVKYHKYSTTVASKTNDNPDVDAARRYCIKLLKDNDVPSYLNINYIPKSARDAYLAIRAFNIEIAKTADTTSNSTVGTLRLQFQKDSIQKTLDGNPPRQPIFILLHKAVQSLKERTNGHVRFSKSWFNRIITTREQYLSNPPFPNLSSFESYSENTYSTLMYLTLQALPMTSISADHVASHIGKATGIATLLKGLPLIAIPDSRNSQMGSRPGIFGMNAESRQGSISLPLDIMAEYNVREEDVLRKGPEAPGLRDAVFAVATRANDHLITAREMLQNIRTSGEAGHDFEHQDEPEHASSKHINDSSPIKDINRAFGVFLPSVSTNLWLETLAKYDFDIFRPELRRTDWKLPYKFWWSHARRRL